MSDRFSPLLNYCGSATAFSGGAWLVEHYRLLGSIGVIIGSLCALTGATIQVLRYLQDRKEGRQDDD